MPKLTALIGLLLLSFVATAQSSHISGSIADTVEKKSLLNGSVLLLRPVDSVLIRHTRTTSNGHFQLNAPPGHYILLITYPAYADYVDTIFVKDTGVVNLPPIGMVLKSKLLETVVVSGNRGAVRLKGDTTEFNADSFKTQAGATVEDLLKKLPGIQVDKNGKITAQGESIKKVLVDGEEFFGDDPTLVTQNLRADMVDKVQVYDKKSEQSTFTGIDDGQREKTINLKLKNDKKMGYFGRLTAGVGTDGYYDEQLMANYFKKKEKIAAYGIISNTGKTGLTWNERDSYGQSIIGQADVDANTGYITIDNAGGRDELDTWSGQYEGQGYPSVKTGGLHFNNKWDDDKFSFNSNYKYMDLNVKGNSTTNTETILPDTVFYNNQHQSFKNQIIRHTLDGTYEVKFDSTSSLKILANGGTDHKTTFNDYYSEYLAKDSSLVNQNNRTTSTVGDKRQLNSYIIWRKKLGKVGRTLSVAIRENFTDDKSTGLLYSDTKFYSGGVFSYDSLVDQHKDFHTTTTLIDSKATYTEPLSKVSFLVANYGLVINNSHSNRDSYNKAGSGKYDLLDSLYSNDYKYNVLTNQGGLAYSYIKKKFRFSAGSNVGYTQYNQHDLIADTSGKRHFVNWNPNANLTYSITNMSRINFNYNGNTQQPTLTQIQPILTNENPLNITIGNPELRPKFTNRFWLSYNNYQVLTDRGVWMSINYNFTHNDIGNSSNIDNTGKTVNQYVNLNGNYNFGAYIDYFFKWAKPDLHIDFSVNGNQSSNASIINGLQNKTVSKNGSLGGGINKSKEKKYDVGVHFNATYTTSQSSINTGIITKYWTYSIQPNGNLFLPLKFQIHGEADISLRPKNATFPTSNNVVLVNGWVGKKFLKNDALLIKVAVNDLLNQNIGFNRTVNSTLVSQNTYSTIKRFGMLSVVWNFTKAGTPAPPNRD